MLDRAADNAGIAVTALVEQILAKNGIKRPVTRDGALTEIGLSSMDLVNLMLAVEAEYDITIPHTDITPGNFRSIDTIEALLARLRGVPS